MNILSENVRVQVSQDFSTLNLNIIDHHYLLIDIGANLTNRKFNRDLESVLQRAEDVGVKKIIVTGTSINSSREALRLARLHPGKI